MVSLFRHGPFFNNIDIHIDIHIEKLKRDTYSPPPTHLSLEELRNKEKIINPLHSTHARTLENVWKGNVFIHILMFLGWVVEVGLGGGVGIFMKKRKLESTKKKKLSLVLLVNVSMSFTGKK